MRIRSITIIGLLFLAGCAYLAKAGDETPVAIVTPVTGEAEMVWVEVE